MCGSFRGSKKQKSGKFHELPIIDTFCLPPPPPRMERGRGGRGGGRGGDREGEREREAGREGGALAKPGNQLVYYTKLQCPFVCLSVPPPPFSTRPSDRNQIGHTYSGRYGIHSQLKKS